MNTYKVAIGFYQGRTEKLIYTATFFVIEENELKAQTWICNYLHAEDFWNFRVLDTEECHD